MHELILITIAGADRPAVTSAVTAILASHNANVLDIGQAVIHDTLSLGLLVEFSAENDSSPAVKEIVYAMHDMDMQVRFQPITLDSYAEWVSHHGKKRHIVTLLARQITAEQLSCLTTIMAEQGLNIDNISRLSGRVALSLEDNTDTHFGGHNNTHDNIHNNTSISSLTTTESTPTKACIEISARGEPQSPSQLRAAFTDMASRLDVDIAFQADSIYRRTRRLVCFDMDSTLIEAEVIDELAKAHGVGDKVAEITEQAMRGELDFNESFAKRMALLKGLDESVLQEIANNLPITEGAEQLLKTLNQLGYKTAILSGGFNYFGRYLQQKLGIDYVFANELEIENGQVTGRVIGTVVNGERKAELLKELAEKENISLEQVIAVGDGANDLPMLSVAGLGIAFRAKPLVKASAKQSISTLGLDAILYLMGFRDREMGICPI